MKSVCCERLCAQRGTRACHTFSLFTVNVCVRGDNRRMHTHARTRTGPTTQRHSIEFSRNERVNYAMPFFTCIRYEHDSSQYVLSKVEFETMFRFRQMPPRVRAHARSPIDVCVCALTSSHRHIQSIQSQGRRICEIKKKCIEINGFLYESAIAFFFMRPPPPPLLVSRTFLSTLKATQTILYELRCLLRTIYLHVTLSVYQHTREGASVSFTCSVSYRWRCDVLVRAHRTARSCVRSRYENRQAHRETRPSPL